MMYYAQNFKTPVAMDRVCHWLVRLGFRPAEIHATRERIPCLYIATDWARAESIQRVVDALNATAPEEIPGAWEPPTPYAGPHQPPTASAPSTAEGPPAGASPIHWDPRDVAWRPANRVDD